MTTTPATTEIDTLKALEQDATPAPWDADTETRGDCVLWGPNGQFVANAQAEPHWLPAADGGKRAVMFDVDRRDVALIAAARNALPALLDELAEANETAENIAIERDEWRKIAGEARQQAEQWEKRYAEMLDQRDTAIREHAAAREELAKVRAELDGRIAWLRRNSTRMTRMRYHAMTAAGYDFTQYTAAVDEPVDKAELIAYLREEITHAEREIALIEANLATTAEPAACICPTWREESPFGPQTITGPDATCPTHGELEFDAPNIDPRNALIMLLHYYGLAFNAHTKQPTADTQAALTAATRMVHTHVEAEAERAAADERARTSADIAAEPAAREVTLAEAAQQARLNLIEAEQRRIATAEPADEPKATRCCPNHREPGEARYGCATAPGVTDPCCDQCHYWVAWNRQLDGEDDPEPAAG